MNIDFAVLIAGILIAMALFFLIRDLTKLVINSILGLLILFFINLFHVMGHIGRTDIPYSLVNILLCILGGIPGALIAIVLHIVGIEGF